jgi:hypothetical protein
MNIASLSLFFPHTQRIVILFSLALIFSSSSSLSNSIISSRIIYFIKSIRQLTTRFYDENIHFTFLNLNPFKRTMAVSKRYRMRMITACTTHWVESEKFRTRHVSLTLKFNLSCQEYER